MTTSKQKADKYDELITAIKYTVRNYGNREREYRRYSNDADITTAYNLGVANTYKGIIEDLERWTNDV